MYINDLALNINESNLGIHLDDLTLGILLYVDDIALLAESKDDLQDMLSLLKTWCYRWRLSIYQRKTQIVHFRKKSRRKIIFGNVTLEYTPECKYLRFTLNEFMTYEVGIKVLADSARRALGSVLNKFRISKDLGYLP